MTDWHCMKYRSAQDCDDHDISGVDCSTCPFRLRELVALDDVQELLINCRTVDDAIRSISGLNSVSSMYLSFAGAEKLAEDEEV